jgi:hypothetical protein
MLDGVCLYKKLGAPRKQEVLSGYILSSVVLMDSRTLDVRRDGANAITGMWKRRGSRKETSKNEMNEIRKSNKSLV